MNNSPDEARGRIRWDDPPRRTPADVERLKRLAALPAEEVERRAMTDPDSPPLTDAALAEMRASEPAAWRRVRPLIDALEDMDDATLLDAIEAITHQLRGRRMREAG